MRTWRVRTTRELVQTVQTAKDCSGCHQPLTRIKWNTTCDILLCYNSNCLRFHQPQGTIPVPKREIAEVFKDSEYQKVLPKELILSRK